MLSNTECNSLFKLAALEDRVEEDIWVCAGYREGGKVVVMMALMPHIMIIPVACKDACEGDSGGPLAVAEGEGSEEVWQLAGGSDDLVKVLCLTSPHRHHQLGT